MLQQGRVVAGLGIKMDENNSMSSEEVLGIIIKTVEYSCWANYVPFSDSPEYSETHDGMRKHLKEVTKIHPALQKPLTRHISSIIRTLHMSIRDYESALKETMNNDPEGRKIIMCSLEAMAQTFQDQGFGVLPKDFLKDLTGDRGAD